MSTITLHPSLDTDGWVNTPVKVCDYMLAHFFLSDYSQTATFPGEVASFSWILQHYQGDVTRICEVTQTTLARYFGKQFAEVDIQVSQLPNPESINEKPLSLYLILTDSDGITHNLARLIHYDGMKVSEIIAVINHG